MKLFTLIALALLFVGTNARAADTRPNIVFILVDDMGYGDLGCTGNANIKTPNIDRLASEGIRFTQYYSSSPICSPSRAALTTGQYPQRWSITSYIAARSENEKRGMAQWLPTEAPSVARIVQSSGYRTAHIGKWHLGGGRDVGEAPLITQYGFDRSLTQFEGLGDRLLPTFDTLFPNQPNRAMPLGVASAKLGRGKPEFVKRHEITPRYVRRSIEFIKSARDANEPFYLNLWPDDVHSPWEPSPNRRGDGSTQAMYRGVIEDLDEALAPLFDMIRDDERLRRNTLIVFASDNGQENKESAAGLRGHKGTLFEGGIRVPFFVWWPGGQPSSEAKHVNEQTVLTGVDLAPSLLKLAGVDAPSDVKFDGQDFSPAFRGEQPRRGTPIFWTHPPDRPGPDGVFPDLAVRKDNLKLLIEEDGTKPQLYDVLKDPAEQDNLAEKNPDVVAELKAKLLAWRDTLLPSR